MNRLFAAAPLLALASLFVGCPGEDVTVDGGPSRHACHPLEQDCPEGEACDWDGDQEAFACRPAGTATTDDHCDDDPEVCGPGFFCTGPFGGDCNDYTSLPEEHFCCKPWCDVDQAVPPGCHDCAEYPGEANVEPGYETVGQCIIED